VRIETRSVKEQIATGIKSRRFSFLDVHWSVSDTKPNGKISLRIDVPKLEAPFWIHVHVLILGKTLFERVIECY